ncbi:MAG: AAA family ATPase [Methylococcales bacterium]
MTTPTTAHFLSDIEIKEFKCFADFKASGFKRVNLIGGKNNVGKTAFMEACFINVHSKDINSMITAIDVIKFQREKLNFVLETVNKHDTIFLDATKKYSAQSNLRDTVFSITEKDATKSYEFEIDGALKYVSSKEINISLALFSYICFIDNFGWSNKLLVRYYQSIQKKEKENELNNFIKEFDGSIENFKVIGDKPQCKTNGEYRDITEFGDGLKHYISIICALYACENGYLFIDEIDNGIYYDQLDRLWEIILTLSKQTNCQVFATTHSKEMLESFARVAKKLNEQDISYTLLVKNKKQEIKSITDDYEMILDSISDGRELRG